MGQSRAAGQKEGDARELSLLDELDEVLVRRNRRGAGGEAEDERLFWRRFEIIDASNRVRLVCLTITSLPFHTPIDMIVGPWHARTCDDATGRVSEHHARIWKDVPLGDVVTNVLPDVSSVVADDQTCERDVSGGASALGVERTHSGMKDRTATSGRNKGGRTSKVLGGC